MARRTRNLVLAALLALVSAGSLSCPGLLLVLRPLEGQLSGPQMDVVIEVLVPGDVEVELDGESVTDQLTPGPDGRLEGTLVGLEEGIHELRVELRTPAMASGTQVRRFETVDLARADFDPDTCELLNAVHCLLPYPSSRFRTPSGDTPNGWRLAIPQVGIPVETDDDEIPASTFAVRDGFSPGAQVMMHFPQGVDVEESGAPRLFPDTRSTDLASLSQDSPTLLIDWETGQRLLHWVENDARAGNPDRRVLFLRPGRSLEPGHRYVVAVRDLVDEAGEPVVAEPVFATLRDRRPTDIPAVTAQRGRMEEIFARLETLGVARDDLVLAFDFQVASDENLTGEMLSMRDQAFAWLGAQDQEASPTFGVDAVQTFDCDVPGQQVWREVRGTFQVPLFLTEDPETDPKAAALLRLDGSGVPESDGFTNPPYGISIPCRALESPETTTVHPLVLGHGLFGDGPDFALDVADALSEAEAEFGLGLDGLSYIGGGTHWRGLSQPDITGSPNLLTSFIVETVLTKLRNFPALPDRLRQGQLNQLVLARMMRTGAFNVHDAFQAPLTMDPMDPGGHGVFREDAETFYFGISLGGIMGLMFNALTPDVTRANVDVPAMNFNCLLQRATPFLQFQALLNLVIGNNPMTQNVGLALIQELWATGEPVGYATHITADPLPGTNPKLVLMTMAWLDQQVSNQCTEIAARTLELPQLEGSLLSDLPRIPDLEGPLDSALVVYHTASFDLDDPTHEPFVPPLTNQQAQPNQCDPHGRRQFIPASLLQLAGFLRPGGQVENFCEGRCDADPAVTQVGPMGVFSLEMPEGDPDPCDPLG